MTILLGRYGKLNTPFYVYKFKSNLYFAIQDINCLFFSDKLNDKKLLSDDDLIKEKKSGNCLILSSKLIKIARLFHSYSLAELCKLSLQEIINGVANPILNSIHIKPNKHMEHLNDFEYEPISLDNLVIPTTNNPIHTNIIFNPPSVANNPICSWLSTHISLDNNKNLMDALISTARIKRQQQAIIETRQRKIAYNNNSSSKRKQNTIAGNNNNNNNNNTITNTITTTTTIKRKAPLQENLVTKKLKSDAYHYNLDLLATQATQLRTLPEISPSPQSSSYRLPSIQTMLSELKNIHHIKL